MGYRLGLVGHDIGHSLSPALHNAAAISAGLEVSYELLDVDKSDLPRIARALEMGDFHGLNVTAPYKKWAFELCQQLDSKAQRTQAVNTLRLNQVGKSVDPTQIGLALGSAKRRPYRQEPRTWIGPYRRNCLACPMAYTRRRCVLRTGIRVDLNRLRPTWARTVRTPIRIPSDSALTFDTVINCLPNHCYQLLSQIPWHALPCPRLVARI